MFDRKINTLLVIIPFLLSLIIGGLGIGFIIIGIKDIKYLDEYDERYINREEMIINMDKNMYIVNDDINYIETDSNEVKAVIEYPKNCEVDFDKNYFKRICNNGPENHYINYYYKALNDGLFVNIDYFKIDIYASKKNIDLLKSNKLKSLDN